jgi:hypothetical protein
MGESSARVTLDVDELAEPIVGKVSASGQPARSFSGWLQLLSALHEAFEGLRARGKVGKEA